MKTRTYLPSLATMCCVLAAATCVRAQPTALRDNRADVILQILGDNDFELQKKGLRRGKKSTAILMVGGTSRPGGFRTLLSVSVYDDADGARKAYAGARKNYHPDFRVEALGAGDEGDVRTYRQLAIGHSYKGTNYPGGGAGATFRVGAARVTFNHYAISSRAAKTASSEEFLRLRNLAFADVRELASDMARLYMEVDPGRAGPNPCAADDFQWEDELLTKVFDQLTSSAGLTQQAGVRKVLIELYKEKIPFGKGGALIRLKPGQIVQVVKHVGTVTTTLSAVNSVANGDYKGALVTIARFGIEAFLEAKGMPHLAFASFAFDIVLMSKKEADRQERLLNVDMAFYKFLSEEKLQHLLDTDPGAAARHYIASHLASKNGKRHRELFQAYIDTEIAEAERVQIDSWQNDVLPVNVGLQVQSPKLRSLVTTMLRDFERRREQELAPGEPTRIRRRFKAIESSASFQALRGMNKVLGSYPGFMDEICQRYMPGKRIFPSGITTMSIACWLKPL